MGKPKELRITSLFGARTRQPYVMLRLGDEVIQMPPGEAQQIGIWLIEAAEAAHSDAAMAQMCHDFGLEDRVLVAMLAGLRAQRDSAPRALQVIEPDEPTTALSKRTEPPEA